MLSASASQLVLAYTQIVRPAHMCLRLRLAAGDDDDASAAAADTAFLACTTRGRLGAKQVRRAWQRHWEHFACGWARKQPPPTTLSFAAYRHVAIALQTSVLLPRAIASATMHASQIVRKKGESKGTEEGAEFSCQEKLLNKCRLPKNRYEIHTFRQQKLPQHAEKYSLPSCEIAQEAREISC